MPFKLKDKIRGFNLPPTGGSKMKNIAVFILCIYLYVPHLFALKMLLDIHILRDSRLFGKLLGYLQNSLLRGLESITALSEAPGWVLIPTCQFTVTRNSSSAAFFWHPQALHASSTQNLLKHTPMHLKIFKKKIKNIFHIP